MDPSAFFVKYYNQEAEIKQLKLKVATLESKLN